MSKRKGEQKTAIVTGATGAIGAAIAEGLAVGAGFDVVLPVRNLDKGERIARAIRKSSPQAVVRVEEVDLSREVSVAGFRERFAGPLHVLVNNAAIAPRRRSETPEGLELQFATNIMGYFWMTEAFSDLLAASAPSRVVNVASYWAGGLDLSDLQFVKRRYDNDAAYRQSKQADRMLAKAFAEKFKPLGISVNACHPGDVNSTLSNALGFGGHETPEEGADTPVWLAVAPEGAHTTGRYFEHRKASHCSFMEDKTAVEKLFEICKSFSSF